MKELELKITGNQYMADTIVEVDGKPVKFKKNEYGNLVYSYQTESDKVNIKAYRLLDIGGIWWFLTQLLFFVISIFGIFDVHRRQKNIIIDYDADIQLQEKDNFVTIKLNPVLQHGKPVTLETKLQAQVNANEFIPDAKAAKTRKLLKFTKLVLALAMIAIIIFCFCKFFIGM